MKKKNLIVFGLSFLLATALFVAIALVFGSGVIGAFQKVTDGWIFGILFMCSFDVIKKVYDKEKLTKTYIAMICLLFANVVVFSFASTTESPEYAKGGIALALFLGILAIALPFIVHAVEVRRNRDNDNDKPVDPNEIQNEWARMKAKVLSLPKEKQKEILKKKLAFRVVGDSLYNALDTSRPMVAWNGYSMTVEAGEKNGADVALIAEAEEYISTLIG